MSDEHEDIGKSLAKKLLAHEKLTAEEKDLLDSSESIRYVVIRELSAPNRPMNGHPGTPPNGSALGKSEREAADRALAHGKAVLGREFPGIFEGSV